ncbi:MAG: hypothetical protein ACYS8W_06155 [Planctomycetota bacterium]
MRKICCILFLLLALSASLFAAGAQSAGQKADSDLTRRPGEMQEELSGWENYFWSSIRWGVLGVLIQTLFYLAASYLLKLTHTELYRAFFLGLIVGFILFFLTIYSRDMLLGRAKYNVLVAGLTAIIFIWPTYRAKALELVLFTLLAAGETFLGFLIIPCITG